MESRFLRFLTVTIDENVTVTISTGNFCRERALHRTQKNFNYGDTEAQRDRAAEVRISWNTDSFILSQELTEPKGDFFSGTPEIRRGGSRDARRLSGK